MKFKHNLTDLRIAGDRDNGALDDSKHCSETFPGEETKFLLHGAKSYSSDGRRDERFNGTGLRQV